MRIYISRHRTAVKGGLCHANNQPANGVENRGLVNVNRYVSSADVISDPVKYWNTDHPHFHLGSSFLMLQGFSFSFALLPFLSMSPRHTEMHNSLMHPLTLFTVGLSFSLATNSHYLFLFHGAKPLISTTVFICGKVNVVYIMRKATRKSCLQGCCG